MPSPRFLTKLNTEQLVWHYHHKYEQLRLRARARAAESASAHNATPVVRTKRRKRLIEAATIACSEANAASFMLSQASTAEERSECPDAFRSWLIERIGTYDWRGAYGHAQLYQFS